MEGGKEGRSVEKCRGGGRGGGGEGGDRGVEKEGEGWKCVWGGE